MHLHRHVRSLQHVHPRRLIHRQPNTPQPQHQHQHHPTLNYSTTTLLRKKSEPLPPRPTLPEEHLKHVYLKGSGPGGQKINKTSSAVQLTHLPTGIVVKSQATRSRSQNHNIAKRILAERIEVLEKGSESRVAKKIERAQRKKASSSKKKRRKYRRLEEASNALGRGDELVERGEEDGEEVTRPIVEEEEELRGKDGHGPARS